MRVISNDNEVPYLKTSEQAHYPLGPMAKTGVSDKWLLVTKCYFPASHPPPPQ
jgi:hypothetical protein